MEIEQKIELVDAYNMRRLREKISDLTEKFNKNGFELTCLNTQSVNNEYYNSSSAILVFTKKVGK